MGGAFVYDREDLDFGLTVLRLLRARGLTQQGLANYSRFGKSYISRLVSSREIHMPTVDRAKVIADYLGLSLQELWDEYVSDTRKSDGVYGVRGRRPL